MQLAAELQVEGTEGEEQLSGVVVYVAEGNAVHGDPVERYDTVGRVDDGVLQAGGLPTECRPGRAAAAALVPLQHTCVATEAEQYLSEYYIGVRGK